MAIHSRRRFNQAFRHGRVAFGRSYSGAAQAAGFTLVEVLIATVLLAAGLTLAFATIAAATRTTQRGEGIAAHSERIRAVEGFLRRRIEASRPVPFNYDQTNGAVQRFAGDRDRMRFVADLPDYLGRGGPYLHELVIEPDVDGGARITLELTMVLAGQTVQEHEPRPPEVLVDGLESARFRYRSFAPDGTLGDWQETWETAEQLPLMVEVTLADTNGAPWPPVVVTLPLAASSAGMPMVTQ